MRQAPNCLQTAIAGSGAAVYLFGLVLLGPRPADAAELADSKPAAPVALSAAPRPTIDGTGIPEIRARLQPDDDIAALQALQVALTEAGDGATYVWGHGNGRLTGAIHMTRTFRDADGRICRHLEMMLTSGTYSRRREGIACRDTAGVWQLDG